MFIHTLIKCKCDEGLTPLTIKATLSVRLYMFSLDEIISQIAEKIAVHCDIKAWSSRVLVK